MYIVVEVDILGDNKTFASSNFDKMADLVDSKILNMDKTPNMAALVFLQQDQFDSQATSLLVWERKHAVKKLTAVEILKEACRWYEEDSDNYDTPTWYHQAQEVIDD